MFNIKLKGIRFNENLGEGSYGQVYAYHPNPEDPDDPESRKWAVKVICADGIHGLLESFQEIVLGFHLTHHFG